MDSVPQKQCSRCKQLLSATNEYFGNNKASKDGLKAACKSCRHIEQKTYYENNTDKCRVSSDAWEEKNKEYLKAWYADYYQAHKDKYYTRGKKWNEENRDKCHEYDKRYREKYPEKVRVKFNRRRNAIGKHTPADITLQLVTQKYQCWWCGVKIKDKKYHVDHRIPLSRGGTDYANNIVISCPHCNMSRADKLPHEWNGRLL